MCLWGSEFNQLKQYRAAICLVYFIYWGFTVSQTPHLCLHHAASVVAHAADEVEDVEVLLLLDPLQLSEEGDEGASPPHARTAVHHQGSLALPARQHHTPDKLEEGSGVVGHTVVRPDREVKLSNNALVLVAVHLEGESADGVLGKSQFFLEVNTQVAVGTFLFLGPILVAFHLQGKEGEGVNGGRGRGRGERIKDPLTLPRSSRLVTMTMMEEPCSHIMRQKSGTESGTGPCVAMKNLERV